MTQVDNEPRREVASDLMYATRILTALRGDVAELTPALKQEITATVVRLHAIALLIFAVEQRQAP